MEDLIHSAVEYTVMAMVGIIGWFGKTLHSKANKSEVEKLEEELQRLREKYSLSLKN